jgi:6-phosphogluconolactonase
MDARGGNMSLKIDRYQSVAHMMQIAAHDFLAELEQVVEKKPFFDVALLGGSTAKDFFNYLVPIAMYHPNLKKIRFFFSDERAVPLESVDSNAGNAWRLLLEPLGIDQAQFFPMYDGIDGKNSAQNYQKLLEEKLLLKKGLPTFDLIYLGLGLDGHIASLFPNSAILEEKTLVSATKEPNIPFERITLMPKILKAAQKVCLLATGAEKKALIDRIIKDDLDVPAEIILKKPKNSVAVLLA